MPTVFVNKNRASCQQKTASCQLAAVFVGAQRSIEVCSSGSAAGYLPRLPLGEAAPWCPFGGDVFSAAACCRWGCPFVGMRSLPPPAAACCLLPTEVPGPRSQLLAAAVPAPQQWSQVLGPKSPLDQRLCLQPAQVQSPTPLSQGCQRTLLTRRGGISSSCC